MELYPLGLIQPHQTSTRPTRIWLTARFFPTYPASTYTATPPQQEPVCDSVRLSFAPQQRIRVGQASPAGLIAGARAYSNIRKPSANDEKLAMSPLPSRQIRSKHFCATPGHNFSLSLAVRFLNRFCSTVELAYRAARQQSHVSMPRLEIKSAGGLRATLRVRTACDSDRLQRDVFCSTYQSGILSYLHSTSPTFICHVVIKPFLPLIAVLQHPRTRSVARTSYFMVDVHLLLVKS